MKTKREAAAFLGVSEKAIERYVNSGKLSKSVEPKEGGGIITYYDEKELATLKKEMENPVSKQSQQGSGVTSLARRSDVLNLLAAAISEKGSRPAVDLTDKALLSIKEAAAISGLSISHIRWAVKARKLKSHIIPHVRGRKIKRTELDTYVAKL